MHRKNFTTATVLALSLIAVMLLTGCGIHALSIKMAADDVDVLHSELTYFECVLLAPEEAPVEHLYVVANEDGRYESWCLGKGMGEDRFVLLEPDGSQSSRNLEKGDIVRVYRSDLQGGTETYPPGMHCTKAYYARHGSVKLLEDVSDEARCWLRDWTPYS